MNALRWCAERPQLPEILVAVKLSVMTNHGKWHTWKEIPIQSLEDHVPVRFDWQQCDDAGSTTMRTTHFSTSVSFRISVLRNSGALEERG
jgi:hypothetical protein